MKAKVIFLLLFATISACKTATYTAPKSSAGGPRIDYNLKRVELPPTGPALILGPAMGQIFEMPGRDTLQIVLTITDLGANRRLEAERDKLQRQRALWRAIAAAMFLLAITPLFSK